MISKKYRLKERDVKKALIKWKPFFSYSMVLNILKNTKGYNRFAIVLGAKSVKNSVERNYFRRKFYNKIKDENFLKNFSENEWIWQDFVFVIKKKTKLVKNEQKSINEFEKNLNFLIKNKWKKY